MFLLKIAETLSYWGKSPELALKYAWVRPENRSELGAQNRERNTIATIYYLSQHSIEVRLTRVD